MSSAFCEVESCNPWSLILHRSESLAATARLPESGLRRGVAFSLTTAASLAAESVVRRDPTGLDAAEAERMLGPESASFELRLWRTVRVSSFGLSDAELRPLFVELVWSFLAAVPRRNLRLAGAACLACCKGEREWRAVVDLFWWRVFAELDAGHPGWEERGHPWPAEFESLFVAMKRVQSAWTESDPRRTLCGLAE